MDLLYHSLLLAQAAPQNDGSPLMGMLFPLLAIMVLFYFLMIRPQRRKEEEHRRMVDNLKENDHVVTIGGIYGVVTNVQRDMQRVTIRVDEATGTKIRVGSSAIGRVITGDESEGAGTTGDKS